MSKHVEFPPLTQEAEKALREADRHLDLSKPGWHRRYLATFLREAVLQVFPGYVGLPSRSHSLLEMADNLYSPPPPAPTLAAARAAGMDTPAGKAAVRDFRASVREVDQ